MRSSRRGSQIRSRQHVHELLYDRAAPSTGLKQRPQFLRWCRSSRQWVLSSERGEGASGQRFSCSCSTSQEQAIRALSRERRRNNIGSGPTNRPNPSAECHNYDRQLPRLWRTTLRRSPKHEGHAVERRRRNRIASNNARERVSLAMSEGCARAMRRPPAGRSGHQCSDSCTAGHIARISLGSLYHARPEPCEEQTWQAFRAELATFAQIRCYTDGET